MKKYSMILCAVAFVALMATSCKKEKQAASFQIQFPQFTEESDERLYVNFDGGNNTYWQDDDRLMIYNISVTNPANSVCQEFVNGAANQIIGDFTPAEGDGVGAVKDGGYYAFYPCAVVDGLKDLEGNSNNDNRETFTFSDTQEYTLVNGKATVDPNSIYFVGHINSGDEFTFKHVGGILRLYISGSKKVQSIVVEDAAYNLTGRLSLKLHEVNTTDLQTLIDLYVAAGGNPWENPAYLNQWESISALGYMSEPEGKTVTLNCGEDGVQLLDAEQSFYIGLRPGALKQGFKLTVHYTDGTFDECEDYLCIDKTIKPGKIRGLHFAF